MSRKTALLLLEGSHEEKFIEDWKLKKYGMTERFDKKTVIHANQIDNIMIAYVDRYDIIYLIMDKDDQEANKKLALADEMSSTIDGHIFKAYIQDPEMESFCASCFEDFVIDNADSQATIKKKARAFLKRKDPEVKQKEWTYSEIIRCGGHLKHAKRYPKRFEIINFLDK